MKKQLKFTLALALSLALLFSLGAAAFADTAEDGLPLEYVSYGVGLPDPAPVDMHELGTEDITLEGVSFDARTDDGHIYIRLSDLAAAKLLRESRDKAAELGLDYSKIYIADGVIFAKDTGNADEVKEVQGLISALKQGALVGVSVDDVFDLGNAGDVKLHVKIRGFAYGDAGSAAPAGSANTPSGENRLLDVKTGHFGNLDTVVETPEVTTIYFYYNGYTTYDTDIDYTYIDNGDALSSYSEGEGGKEEKPTQPDIETRRNFYLDFALAYSQKDADDGVQYYVWVNGKNVVISAVNGNDDGTIDESSFLAEDISGKTLRELVFSDILCSITNSSENSSENPVSTIKIKITTDAEGNDVVKTIDFNDATPDPDEVLDVNEDGSAYVIKDAVDAPEGYKKNPNGQYGGTPDNPSCGASVFLPDENLTVPDDAISSSDVTIDAHDDVTVIDPSRMPS